MKLIHRDWIDDRRVVDANLLRAGRRHYSKARHVRQRVIGTQEISVVPGVIAGKRSTVSGGHVNLESELVVPHIGLLR